MPFKNRNTTPQTVVPLPRTGKMERHLTLGKWTLVETGPLVASPLQVDNRHGRLLRFVLWHASFFYGPLCLRGRTPRELEEKTLCGLTPEPYGLERNSRGGTLVLRLTSASPTSQS